MVLEALPRIGGRVLSHRTAAGCYDLGPAWVWPTLQPRIAQLVEALGLDLYAQAEAGGFIYQDAQGNVQRLANGFPQEPPSMRVHGGIEALIEAIGAECRSDTIRLQTRVRGISVHQDGVDVTAEGPEGPIGLRARRVVLALPPRLVGGIDLSPTLPAAVWNRLHEVPTWMGGHAKALAIYDRPHWREASLSAARSVSADRCRKSTTPACRRHRKRRYSASLGGMPDSENAIVQPSRNRWSHSCNACSAIPRAHRGKSSFRTGRSSH